MTESRCFYGFLVHILFTIIPPNNDLSELLIPELYTVTPVDGVDVTYNAFYKIGRLCVFAMRVNSYTCNGSTTVIGAMPTECLPFRGNIYFSISSASSLGSGAIYGVIDSNISVNCNCSNASVFLEGAYITAT